MFTEDNRAWQKPQVEKYNYSSKYNKLHIVPTVEQTVRLYKTNRLGLSQADDLFSIT
jgi:hypothetical protein